MKKYFSPFVILANGTITMTDSQLGELGIDIDVGAWNEFWAACDGQVLPEYENFDIQNPGTWPAGFDQYDQESWYILLGF